MSRPSRPALTAARTAVVGAVSALLLGGLVPAVSALEPVPGPTPATGTASTDTTPPTGTLSGGLVTTSPFVLRFSEPVRGVDASTVSVTPADGAALVVAADGRSATVRPVSTWYVGQRYVFRVTDGVTDLAGNPLPAGAVTVRVATTVDDGDRAMAYGGAWGVRRSSDALGGSFRTSRPTPRSQTAVTVRVAGSTVVVGGCVGPANGLVDVWVDGTRRGRFDTYRSYSGCGVRLARLQLPAGRHRVQVRGIGQRSPDSRGTAVSVDGIAVS